MRHATSGSLCDTAATVESQIHNYTFAELRQDDLCIPWWSVVDADVALNVDVEPLIHTQHVTVGKGAVGNGA